MKRLLQQKHIINPSADWVCYNKSVLLSIIRQEQRYSSITTTGEQARAWQIFTAFVCGRMNQGIMRSVFVGFLIIAVTVSGWISGVNASYNSLPGETLYTVKLATERFQIALGDNETQVKLNLEFASRRVEEATQVVKTNPQLAVDAIAHADKTVNSAKKKFSSAVQKKNPEQAVAFAKDFSNKTQTIAQRLDNVKLAESQKSDSLTKEVAETKQNVIETSLDVVTEVVKQVDPTMTTVGTTSPSSDMKELVSQTVVSVLEGVEKTVEETKGTVDELKGLKAMNSSTPVLMSTTTTVSPAPISVPVQSGSTASSNTIAQVIAQAEQTSEFAGTVAGQVETLIAQQNLLGALEKTKEISVATSETQQAVVDANNKAKELGPIPEVLGATTSSSPVAVPTESKPINVTATGTAKEVSINN